MLKSKGIILRSQKEFLVVFSTLSNSENFYLTGGTALAEFYYGHKF